MIELGQKVKDIVTGYEGIATAKTEYLNGCVQVTVTPRQTKKAKETGEYPECVKLDIEQLVAVSAGVNTPKLKVVKTRTGGPPKRTNGRNKH